MTNRQQTCKSSPLELRRISKHFGGVYALRDVDLRLAPGQIHALVGENGAGKSTLVNIATGILKPDDGDVLVAEQPVRIGNPVAAARMGIHAVHQEADLFAELSLAENMLLGRGLVRNKLNLIDWRRTYKEAQQELGFMGESLEVRDPAHRYSIGRRVIAEIAAVVARQPKVLFLDEPSASLTAAESQRLFEQIRILKSRQVAIVYISHRLEEVLELSDTITVLRDGRTVATEPAQSFDMDRLVALMVGRQAEAFFSRNHGRPGDVVFELDGFSCPDRKFTDITLSVRRGEIVGLYGLVGAGRSETARAIFGLAESVGSVKLHGRDLARRSPSQIAQAGLAYLSEDRLTEGIFANHSCRSNVTSAILRRICRLGMISRVREDKAVREVIDQFSVKLDTPEQAINTLSGGNQQKLVLGRWLQTQPEFLILDEPTRGVDVGAKKEIHRLIDQLAASGMAILMISSELPEVTRMSDRVLVMREGRIAGQFDPRQEEQDTIAAAAFPKSQDDKQNAQLVQSRKGSQLLRFRELGIVAALAVVVAVMSTLRTAEFATVKNMIDVLTSASILSVGAAGMTLVIITGGIDISVGSVLGLVAASTGLIAMKGMPPIPCLLIALTMGAALASLNSIMSTLGRIHPIIVTLAGISIYRGIMLKVTGGYEVNPLPEGYRALTDGTWFGVPGVLWIALLVLLLNWLLLNRTLTGRRMLAVGNSEKAARLIGLSPWRLRLMSFAVMGLLVGLASVMWGGYYGKIQSNTGNGWELQVIAATVIGGCSIMGGRGTALGTFLGAVLITLIYNSLVILRISSYWQNLFVGTLILAAVLLDAWLPEISRWNRRRKGASA